MGKPFRIDSKSWVYLEKFEQKHIESIIRVLREHKSLSTTKLAELSGMTRQTIGKSLSLLLAKRVVRVRQFGRSRIYDLYLKYRKPLNTKGREEVLK